MRFIALASCPCYASAMTALFLPLLPCVTPHVLANGLNDTSRTRPAVSAARVSDKGHRDASKARKPARAAGTPYEATGAMPAVRRPLTSRRKPACGRAASLCAFRSILVTPRCIAVCPLSPSRPSSVLPCNRFTRLTRFTRFPFFVSSFRFPPPHFHLADPIQLTMRESALSA